MFSTWVRAELLLQLEGELGLLDCAPRLNRRADVAQDRVPLAHRQSHLSVRCETDAERCNAGAPGAKLALMGPERRRSGVRVVRGAGVRGASVEPECMAPFGLGNARPRRPGQPAGHQQGGAFPRVPLPTPRRVEHCWVRGPALAAHRARPLPRSAASGAAAPPRAARSAGTRGNHRSSVPRGQTTTCRVGKQRRA